MAYLVYSDLDYEKYPYGRPMYENTEAAAIRAYVNRVRGANVLPDEGEQFTLTPLGEAAFRKVVNVKPAFKVVDE